MQISRQGQIRSPLPKPADTAGMVKIGANPEGIHWAAMVLKLPDDAQNGRKAAHGRAVSVMQKVLLEPGDKES